MHKKNTNSLQQIGFKDKVNGPNSQNKNETGVKIILKDYEYTDNNMHLSKQMKQKRKRKWKKYKDKHIIRMKMNKKIPIKKFEFDNEMSN
mmetsp:Transcript_35058/g.37968  ORF Transcript_35058/g.37968 Transcript_35058/m.37968 type:complete len:90 (+) Transcript_35058:534-803(+)